VHVSEPPSAAVDRRIVAACLAAEPGAWDAFVSQFAGLFVYVVERTASQRGMRLSAADRDDLVADVLLECLRNDAAVLRGFAGRSSLATYLTVISRRVAVRGLLRLLEAGPLSADPAAPPSRSAVDRDEVESLLGLLDETEAKLVRLHHLEARSYGEISRLTGLPLGSIGPALSRARQKMRSAAG
jgi:RNA polymerase sigma-70 factor (ECF subfamily)